MRKKQMTAMAAGAIATVVALSGCAGSGSGETTGSGDALQVYLNMTTGSAQYAQMQTLADSFTEATGIDVDLTIDSSNFENNMKVRMASGNLPDVWSTHGWSVLRYGPFLEPLTDQPWAQYVAPGLDASMRDENGDLYALPIEYTVAGLMVNFDVLDQAGVDPDAITTMDDLTDALAAVKAAGKTPIVSSGKDNGPAGDLANFIASGAFSSAQLEDFSTGTFDADAYESLVLDPIAEWSEAGYFNPDYVSATIDDMAQQLAQGQAAIAVTQPSLMTTALTFNPDANIGFIPFVSQDGQYLVGGEGTNALGVWKDSPRKEEALEFLDFLADPVNAVPLVEAIGTYSGLTNVTVDLGTLQASYDEWVAPGELETLPFFDRVYLPNGMWSTIVSSTDAVIAGQSTATTAVDQMETQYETLFNG
ncbi:ABC transporter substrate-binding protein [Microbacterium sp. 18062]|uniref:ABC transporter substrate-binding protein n=1 Tax=Microbacterium sp. 18062 TaxID=2681410 RepID=UPI00135CB832|nr:ABC transporter substrate-binding protein [Microbacterium sp. 18062]